MAVILFTKQKLNVRFVPKADIHIYSSPVKSNSIQ
jgi:hypothetical protein